MQRCLLLYSSIVYSCRMHSLVPERDRFCLPLLQLTYEAKILLAPGQSYARTYELLNFLVLQLDLLVLKVLLPALASSAAPAGWRCILQKYFLSVELPEGRQSHAT